MCLCISCAGLDEWDKPYAWVCKYIYTCIHVYIYTCIHIYIYTYIHIYIYIYIHIYIYTYIPIHTPSPTHMQSMMSHTHDAGSDPERYMVHISRPTVTHSKSFADCLIHNSWRTLAETETLTPIQQRTQVVSNHRYTHIHTYIHIYMYIYTHKHVYVYIYIYACVCENF